MESIQAIEWADQGIGSSKGRLDFIFGVGEDVLAKQAIVGGRLTSWT